MTQMIFDAMEKTFGIMMERDMANLDEKGRQEYRELQLELQRVRHSPELHADQIEQVFAKADVLMARAKQRMQRARGSRR
jgi:hypothetical protein